MKKTTILSKPSVLKASMVALGFFLLSACMENAEESVQPQHDENALLLEGKGDHSSARAMQTSFTAHLSGREEVPPVDTRAKGQAIFQLSKDGTELHYKLIAANIIDVSMAHIHLAPAGQNGGVVVWLYPSAPPAQLIPGMFQGVLGEGVITSANLVGALAGQDLSTLIDNITSGNAYVNVHTSNYPGGEIRGQIK